MRLRSFLALLALTVALVACGDDVRTTTRTPTSAATTTVRASELDPMLLDARDVGAGWRVGPDVNAADFVDATQIPCPDVALNPTIAARLKPVTGIQFEPTDRSYKHLIEFVLTGDASRLAADLQASFDAIDSCPDVTSATPETVTIDTFTLPELGDQRAAFTLVAGESPDATSRWYVRHATVRVGRIAIRLSLTEILSTPRAVPDIGDERFVELVETAVAKAAA